MTTTAAPGPEPSYKGGMLGKLPSNHQEFKGGFLTNLVAPIMKSGIIQMIDNYEKEGERVIGSWKSHDDL